jgi:ABC-type branched-subunit amino acid transport system substrate-binding protein
MHLEDDLILGFNAVRVSKLDLKAFAGKPEISPFHLNQHDAMRTVIEALKIAGTDDRAALRDALEKVRYQGLIADFAYPPTDHDGQSGAASELPIIKDGEFFPYKK